MRFGVITFPGSNCDHDSYHVCAHVLGESCRFIWHAEAAVGDIDCLFLPGGFSYGDYLRCGAIARFAPVMADVRRFADRGGLVIGVCNGFQILCESGLLPGTLIRNQGIRFLGRWVRLRVESTSTPFTSRYMRNQVLRIPIAHGEGNYFTDPQTLASLERNNQVAFRYCDEGGALTEAGNPNGALNCIAGITNVDGNVLGMMPHPERAAESILGSTDGLPLFESIRDTVLARQSRPAKIGVS